MVESSTTTMNQLPEELIKSEILTRLPGESLMRFKSVSKSWYALFHSQKFITAHRLFHQNNNTGVLVNGLTLVRKQVLFVMEMESILVVPDVGVEKRKIEDIRLVGSCSVNGIVCLLMNNSAPFLLNPAIREFKLLPSSNPYEELIASRPLLNNVDFRTSYDGYGFGYDPIADDYKVVRNGHLYNATSTDAIRTSHDYIEVYSLRRDSWKMVRPNVGIILPSKGGVLLNGMFHWMTGPGATSDNSINKMLVSFDISTELYSTTYAPYDNEDIERALHLGEDLDTKMMEEVVALNGSIAMITFDNTLSTGGRLFDVWVLGEVGVKESWTKYLTIGPLLNVEKPLGVGKNGDIFFLKDLSLGNDDDDIAGSKDTEVACYDPKTQMLRNLEFEFIGFKLHGETLAFAIYSESLVSLQKILEDAGN